MWLAGAITAQIDFAGFDLRQLERGRQSLGSGTRGTGRDSWRGYASAAPGTLPLTGRIAAPREPAKFDCLVRERDVVRIAGIILAGGDGTRLGMHRKPLAMLAGRTLIDRVVERVLPQVDVLALSVRKEAIPAYDAYRRQGMPLITDDVPRPIGPLAGIAAGLAWISAGGSGHDWLATFPADTPFLPHDLVATLAAGAAGDARPVAVFDGERVQGLCALWPLHCRERLRAEIDKRTSCSVSGMLAELDARRCVIRAPQAFLNVNTPADLSAAEAYAMAL
jgi:molybdopterin-guanine dinucleotide biosynthesis protein A